MRTSIAVSGLLAAIVAACSAFSGADNKDVVETPDASPSDSDAASNGDVAAPPIDDPVDPAIGVFVDAVKGDDQAGGTQAAPVKTIGHALDMRADKSVIYVCAGTYPEAVSVTEAVSIEGGWDCGSWKSNGAPTVIADAFPLSVRKTGATTTVRRVTLRAKDGDVGHPSSIGAFLVDADVELGDVTIEVGRGASMPKQTGVTVSVPPATPGNPGDATGGATASCVYHAHDVSGGRGQAPAFSAANGGGFVAMQTWSAAKSCPGPNPNAPGKSGTDGASGGPPPVDGTLDDTGWTAGSGLPGDIGQDGTGGGGGGDDANGPGGGGGCGGCGADGGLGGAGGGGSIGILSLRSHVTVKGGSITTAGGGDGQAGAAPKKQGQSGGTGGGSSNSPMACRLGANGGKGGDGGRGGPGAGGISAGILWKDGQAPSLPAKPTFKIGTPGFAGDKTVSGGTAGRGDEILVVQTP